MEITAACSSNDFDSPPVISCAKLPCHVDLPALQDELARLLEATGVVWVDHVNRKDYSGALKVVCLDCPAKEFKIKICPNSSSSPVELLS